MASIIGKLAGEVTQTIVKGQSHDILQGPLNKSWRALLLLNRATSKMPKIESIEKGGLDDLNHHVATWESTSIAQDITNAVNKAKQELTSDIATAKSESNSYADSIKTSRLY